MSNKKRNNKNPPTQKITTIKLLEETKLRIEKLREHKRESYDDVLRKILYVLNVARDDPEKARRILEKIDEIKKRNAEEEIQRKEELEKEKRKD